MAAREQRAQRLCVPTHAWAPCLSSWANGPPGPSLPGPRLCSQPGRGPRRSTQGQTRLAVRPAGPELGRAVWALLSLSCTEWNFTRCRRVRAESVPPRSPRSPGVMAPHPRAGTGQGLCRGGDEGTLAPQDTVTPTGLQLRTRAGLARDPAGPRISPPGGNLGGPWGTGPHVVLAVRWEPGRPRASLATARCPVSTKPLKCQLTLKPVPDWSRGGGQPSRINDAAAGHCSPNRSAGGRGAGARGAEGQPQIKDVLVHVMFC